MRCESITVSFCQSSTKSSSVLSCKYQEWELNLESGVRTDFSTVLVPHASGMTTVWVWKSSVNANGGNIGIQ